MLRKLLALAAAALLAAPTAAQTVRFQTSVGAFDMLLNPTNNADLQPLVDNMLANVATGVYHRAVVNRAVTDFVLQIGSFQTETDSISAIPEFGFGATNSLDPVIVDSDLDGQVDFTTTSNTRGTVSLALSAGNPNSGSSSFFINLTDNSGLDAQGFVPFATIADLATVDRIMGQQIVDLSATVQQNGSLAYTDVPLADDGDLIVIENAFVVSDDNQAFLGPLRNTFELDSPGFFEDSPEPPEPPVSMPGDEEPPIDDPFAGLTVDQINSLTTDQVTMLLDGSVTAEELFPTVIIPGLEGGAVPVAAPEPTSALLVAAGLLTLGRRR